MNENLSIDSSVPPSADSPSQILNALNDDCIQEILRHLTNIQDFLSASEVCTRFQENAKSCFAQRHKDICISEINLMNSIPVERVESFLNNFGHLIKSIQWNKTDRTYDINTMKLIAKFTGQTLSELTIRDHNIDMGNEKHFEALQKLEIESGAVSNFRLAQRLTILKLHLVKVMDFDSFVQDVPHIVEIELSFVKGFNDRMLIDFFKRNPQLQSLKLENCNRVSSEVLRLIHNRLPKIERLEIGFLFSLAKTADMLDIGRLRGLQRLSLKNTRFEVKTVIASLVKNETPIEDLYIDGYIGDFTECILKFKRLKYLHVNGVSETFFVTLVKELPVLERLRVVCSEITPVTIAKVLKNGKHLSNLVVVVDFHAEFNLESYNSILTAAKDRVRVLLMIRTEHMEFEQPNFLNANRKWLNICYF